MNSLEARSLVLRHCQKTKVNAAWLAIQIGEPSRQKVHAWLKGIHEPSDPTVWVRMANTLGLGVDDITPRTLMLARDLAIEVLVRSTDERLREIAAQIVREISGKTYD